MGDAHEERVLLKIFAMQSGSDYLPWIARAARRVQGRAHAAESIDHTPRLAVSGPLGGLG